MKSPVDIYRERYDSFLQDLARNLQGLILSHVADVPRIDGVIARAKEPDHFAVKADKTGPRGGKRYRRPLTEIQDQIGARVIVLYLDTVEIVSERLEAYFQPIEETALVPESNWEFGYFGKHYVMALPGDVVPAGVPIEDAPRFFELQIKTLFQHAWSESNHDLGYKAIVELSSDQQRHLAFGAAQAWGADHGFESLRQQLDATTSGDTSIRRSA